MRIINSLLSAAVYSVTVAFALAPSGKWDAFNFAPASKTVYPVAVHSTSGLVTNAGLLVDNKGSSELSGNQSWVTLDFGKEVGGLVSLNFDAVSQNSGIALSFTESPLFIRPTASDDSTDPSQSTTRDGVLDVDEPLIDGYWTQPAFLLRGGFRYLTLVSTGDDPVTLSNVSVAIAFMPHVDDLRAYSGYFYTTDPASGDTDLLTKIWYAGAYTVQTNTIPANTGRMVPAPSSAWANNATAGIAGPLLVDGAKRDRAVWPGDMGIAVPTQFVSTNDLLPTKNSLSTILSMVDPQTGQLPMSGPPISVQGSDTYHGWTLLGTYNYFLYSGDTEWLQSVFANYTKAVGFLENKVDDTGLMFVTGTQDWARQGQGGHNSEANAILYRVLTTGAELASHIGDSSLASAWAQNATVLKKAYNDILWLESAGMYRDNSTTELCPEDGNSLAIFFNLTQSDEQKTSISDGLVKNWNEIGPVTPELPDTIIPFIAGFEIQAHFEAGNDARALDLIRRTWGFMLTTNTSVQSTLLEGFTANGSLAYRYNMGYNDDTAYTSHAHGWSTGATSALTFYLVGLQVTSPQGQTWLLAPHTEGGLPAAQGGFETQLGWYGAEWELGADGRLSTVRVETPKGTIGTFSLPKSISKNITRYTVDGQKKDLKAGQLLQIELQGGQHTIVFE